MNWAFRSPEEDRRLNFLVGAVRSGKTWAIHPKIISCSLPKELGGYEVSGRKILTGVSKKSVYDNVLTDVADIIGGKNFDYNKQSGDCRIYDVPWIVVGAKDEGSEKYIRGMTVGVAICDEVIKQPQTFFQMLLSRMSPDGARMYGSTNPDSPYHWFKTDYLDDPVLRDILWWQTFTMDDNPNLGAEFVASQKKLFTGLFYKRFIEGLWVMAEGSIYKDSWSDELLYDSKDEPPGLYNSRLMRYVAIDYGTTNPTVFLDIYDDGKLYWVTREYYWDSAVHMCQKTDAEYADDLVAFIGAGLRAKVIIDPSAASFKAEMTKRGIWHVDADNEVLEGIKKTSIVLNKRMVRIRRDKNEHGIKEMQTYAWDSNAAKRGEEKPLKMHDHWPDAFRYFVQTEVPQWRIAA